MRALRPMTDEERKFAEQKHDLVIDFLRCKEARIIRFLVDGFALHEAARLLKMPRATAMSCMENFFCRARAVMG